MFMRLCAVVLTAVLLSGCNTLGIDRTRLAQAEPLFGSHFDKEQDKCLDDPLFLFSLTASREARLSNGELAIPPDCDKLYVQLKTYGFGDWKKATTEEMQWRRNEVVDALVAVSNDKCGSYSAHLKTFDGQTNSALSVLAILTGGVGGIVQGAEAARILSGSSAMLSGSRTAINESWFSSQTIHVLVAAYEKARERQRRDITNRQACPITSYTLMDGMGDAMHYHASCSILTGLAEAAQAIERSDQPGLDTMRRQLADLTSIREQASHLISASSLGNSLVAQRAMEARNARQRALDALEGQLIAAQSRLADAEIDAEAAQLATDPDSDEAAIQAALDNDTEVKKARSAIGRLEGAIKTATENLGEAEGALEDAVVADQNRAAEERRKALKLEASVAEAAICPYSVAVEKTKKTPAGKGTAGGGS